ncbi:hypothetical protein ACFWWM_34120 [Streptomyces sp. NPDC058682]|uniref:hypothetical protein n=1 Tax=Streptomyces sp. NPDC058682 TaxID=3346596 RepID=UPI00366227DC
MGLVGVPLGLRTGGDEPSPAVAADATMILVARERRRTHPGRRQEATPLPESRARNLVLLSLALASPVVRTSMSTTAPP